jgi:hypothetical protein
MNRLACSSIDTDQWNQRRGRPRTPNGGHIGTRLCGYFRIPVLITKSATGSPGAGLRGAMNWKVRCSAAVLLIVSGGIAGDGQPAIAYYLHSDRGCGGTPGGRSVREVSAIDEMWEQSSRAALEF